MFKRIVWVLFSVLVLLPVRAEAQTPSCDKSWFNKAPGSTGLGDADLKAICDPRNAQAFETAVSACGNEKTRCSNARKSCPTPTSTSFDDLARCYHAAGDPTLLRDPQAPGPSSGQEEARAEGLAAAGAVSIVAQGVGDFLIQRAEQEVALYAATELQKALCDKYGDVYFPKSCTLLKQSDDDGEPVGLGTLRRALEEDLRVLPGSVLGNVMDRIDPKYQNAACSLDVAYAFATGVLKEGTVVPLLQPDATDGGHLRLHRYRVKFLDTTASPPTRVERCDATWVALREAAKVLQEVRLTYENAVMTDGMAGALAKARLIAPNLTPQQLRLLELWAELIQALNDVRTGSSPKESSARAVRAAVALLKQLMPERDAAAVDEGGAIAIAIIEGDWIGIVAAVASADQLGLVLLCEKDARPCQLDTKVRATLRLVGDVASADSSAGVTSALERFAAPLGSWRRKYQGGLYLMANGYVGAKYAWESVKDARGGTALAPVLALGLEFGGNIGRLARIGVFAQAIDVGNVSSVRLSESDDPNLTHVEVAPDVVAAQLLAPGLFLTVAPWKAPFAVNLGFDWVPELRTVGGGQEAAWHVGGAFVVDTPILELYHE